MISHGEVGACRKLVPEVIHAEDVQSIGKADVREWSLRYPRIVTVAGPQQVRASPGSTPTDVAEAPACLLSGPMG